MAGSLILGLLDDQLICSIHDGTIVQPRELACRHSFCQRCLVSLAESSGEERLRCPTCRRVTILPDEGVAGLETPQDIMDLLRARNGLVHEPEPPPTMLQLPQEPQHIRPSRRRVSPSAAQPWYLPTPTAAAVVNSHRKEDSYEDVQRNSFHRPRLQSMPILPPPLPLPPNVPVFCGNEMQNQLSNDDNELPHKRTETWFTTFDRQNAAEVLHGKRNGTFLLRPAGRMRVTKDGALHNYSIDLVYNGIKHLRVLKRHNLYGFNVKNCVYSSLLEMVVYYSQHSLDTHNPALTTTLSYPYNA